jgi:hypothetical protein
MYERERSGYEDDDSDLLPESNQIEFPCWLFWKSPSLRSYVVTRDPYVISIFANYRSLASDV